MNGLLLRRSARRMAQSKRNTDNAHHAAQAHAAAAADADALAVPEPLENYSDGKNLSNQPCIHLKFLG